MIANGFMMGDIEGKYTCCTWNGMSVNDVFIFHKDLQNYINYFKVGDEFQWYSDHRVITASFSVDIQKPNAESHSQGPLPYFYFLSPFCAH